MRRCREAGADDLRLEQAVEAEERGENPPDLPSGDVLAREFQRFLRQRGSDPPR